jgi:hypothetical protein
MIPQRKTPDPPAGVPSKDNDRDRRDVLARIVKKLKRVHSLTRTEVRATFYPQSIESLRLLAKDYGIELPEILLADAVKYDTDLLEEFEKRQEKKKKEAERKRLARKSKSDQLMAIKEALKIPVREVIASTKRTELERQIAETEEQRETSMNLGRHMTGDPDQQQLITNTDIEKVAAARGRATALGSSGYDSETGEAHWPENDRRIVRAQGSSNEDEQSWVKVQTRDGKLVDQRPTKRFVVKLDGADPTNNPLGISRDEWLSKIARRFFVKGGSAEDAPDTFFVCRLCHFECDWDTETKRHMEEVHGDEQLPSHDPRFGNVIEKHLNEIEAADRKRQHPKSADALNS